METSFEEKTAKDLKELAKNISDAFVAKLPEGVKKRVTALTNLQVQFDNLERQRQAELKQVADKYAQLYQTLFDKRAGIVSGAVEPTEADLKEVTPQGEVVPAKKPEEGEPAEHKYALPTYLAQPQEIPDGPGVPGFWLKALRTYTFIGETITERDEEALKFLSDVKCNAVSQRGFSGTFTLEFHFADNEFFTNKVLTKTYHHLEENLYTGHSFDFAEGCAIDWKTGKNLTVKVVQKKQKKKKGKGAGQTRVIETVEKCDSFFNFFSPPKVDEIEAEAESEFELEELEDRLERDYSIGCVIKDFLVPAALRFFTGDGLALLDDADLESPEFEDFDDEEEEDEDDDDEPPMLTSGRGGRGGRGGAAPAVAFTGGGGTVLGGGGRGGGRGGRGGGAGGVAGAGGAPIGAAPGGNPFQPSTENPECKQQ
jgi:nucleosome assembly protein 1-like 1